jgi:lipopolysaccharide transport system ATP-binding protein
MKQLAIQAENISKQYRLGQVGTGTLSHDLNRFWHKIRGNEDPYLKIGEANDRSQKSASEYVWSLRDINFEIEQGDAVGIIGRNGAGKSTLLKLLSKVTKPTTGQFKVNGRIASLLEVGTGFHPEMTGRENIYLNGAILGMRRHEITRKFDEIVDFSGVGGYIDTPVKRYSSGMYVRLAFAVAAHLESEILIVDEVLAVGDAEFQKKCLGKMGDVSKGEGRTVLFVSHNMGAVKELCNNSIYLENGTIKNFTDTPTIIDEYISINNSFIFQKHIKIENKHRKYIQAKEIEIIDLELIDSLKDCNYSTDMDLKVKINLRTNVKVPSYRIAGSIFTENHIKLGTFFSNQLILPDRNEFSIIMNLLNHNLSKGKYFFALSIGVGDEKTDNREFDIVYEVLGFQITHKDYKNPILKWPSDWGSFNFKSNIVEND